MDASIARIEEHLNELFKDKIDLSDLPDSEDVKAAHFRTRALAAYSLIKELDISIDLAADAVIDGGQDFGMDAILNFSGNKTIYIVQSKFVHSDNGGIEKGDILSFVDGVRQLFNNQITGANPRLTAKMPSVQVALGDSETKAKLIVISTGCKLAGESKHPIDRFLDEKNAQSDERWLLFDNPSHNDVLEFVASDKAPKDVTLEIPLKDWGSISSPHKSFYGQISAMELGKWYKEHGKDLVSSNIRSYLGANTDINKKITETLKTAPTRFFYLSNGLTAICTSVKNTNKFSDSRTAGSFECENLKIINGAQTFGCIGKAYRDDPESLKDAWVMFKVISVGSSDEALRQLVTVATNSQNKIESIDFASMEPQQIRLEKEILKDFGLTYIRMREDMVELEPGEDISMAEAASALACFEDDVKICITHKREINKIWDSLLEAPYTMLFNAHTTSKKVVNSVATHKKLKRFIAKKKLKRGREATFSKSGDHLLLHMIFNAFENRLALIQKTPEDFKAVLDEKFDTLADTIYNEVWGFIEATEKYKSAQLARLLISPKLMVNLKSEILDARRKN